MADSRHQPTVRPQRLAIGVFGRAPVAGAVKRRLSPPLTPERAAELSSAMLADLLGVLTLLPMGYRTVLCEADAELEALKKNLPARWHIAATGGASFGARLEAGLAHLFDQNVEAAGIVTNDSPLVSLDELYEGFMWLTKRRGLLLGPTSSGGLYAFALTHPEPALLKDFDWKSDGLVDRLKHHARELKLDTQVLATVTDVETSDDLKRFVKEMGGPNKPIGGLPAMTKLLAANDFAFAK